MLVDCRRDGPADGPSPVWNRCERSDRTLSLVVGSADRTDLERLRTVTVNAEGVNRSVSTLEIVRHHLSGLYTCSVFSRMNRGCSMAQVERDC